MSAERAALSGAPGPLWDSIRAAARAGAEAEPALDAMLTDAVLDRSAFESAFAHVISGKLATQTVSAAALVEQFDEAIAAMPEIGTAARADLDAFVDRDPACGGPLGPLLFAKGFHALQTHRVAQWFWTHERTLLAQHLQSRSSEVFGVDIHPAARIGRGIFIDHATSVVMGETTVVDDAVSLLHEVTLGGTGKQVGDRHPKIRRGVLICAGAKVLGNVEVGEGAKVAAGSVVLEDVPPHATVAGVPAVVVGRALFDQPALEMDQRLPHD